MKRQGAGVSMEFQLYWQSDLTTTVPTPLAYSQLNLKLLQSHAAGWEQADIAECRHDTQQFDAAAKSCCNLILAESCELNTQQFDAAAPTTISLRTPSEAHHIKQVTRNQTSAKHMLWLPAGRAAINAVGSDTRFHWSY